MAFVSREAIPCPQPCTKENGLNSAMWRLLLFLLCGLCLLTAQSISDQAAAIPVTSSYKLEWKRHFDIQVGITGGVSDEVNALWLVPQAGPGALIKIGADGQLAGTYYVHLPLRADEWIESLCPAVTGHNVGLLASLVSGGRLQTFEGAFFIPVGSDGLGVPKRVAGQGPQYLTMVGTEADQFIAAGDQEPLTLLKLDRTGTVLWRRSFSRKLVLPTLDVGPNGGMFMLSQSEGGDYVLLQSIDQSGNILASKRISAAQGTVKADREGGCSVLLSKSFHGKDNRVYLATFDRTLRQLREVETPLYGRGGCNYQLILTPTGHLLIGESFELGRQVIAEYHSSGTLRWQQEISSEFTPLLVPSRTGFYVVRNRLSAKSFDVERYSWGAN